MTTPGNRQRRYGGSALIALSTLLLAGLPLNAQHPEQTLPTGVAEAAIDFFNAPVTLRFIGEAAVPAGAELKGDVAVLGGPLLLAGRITGSVAVINGNLVFREGGQIDGDLTVIGGTVTGPATGRVAGEVRTFKQPLRLRRDGDLIAREQPRLESQVVRGRQWGNFRASFTGRVHGAYNRAEGLPVAAGPRVEWLSTYPLLLEAFAVYRTESGLRVAPDEFGYLLRLSQRLSHSLGLNADGALYSEMAPVEMWGISDLENALSTFMLRRDYRDYYERTGGSVHLSLAPDRHAYQVQLGLTREQHRRVDTRGPWTLVRNDEEWRPQPAVAQGRLYSMEMRVKYDTRNVSRDPSTGWLMEARTEHGLGGDLTLSDGEPARERFRTGFIDLRRYARTGPESRLALRVLAGGSLDGRALPPQRQHALGGAGSLPAYSLFQFDCGARSGATREIDGKPFYDYYGCDRAALVQIEYSALFPFVGELVRGLGWDAYLGETPGWLAFFNAGRAWTEEAAASVGGRTTGQRDYAADAGLGLRFGQLGIYWTLPLSGSGRGLDIFIRASSRL